MTSDTRAAQSVLPHDDDSDEGFDIREMIGVVLSRWPWIAASMLIGTALAVLYLFVTPPTYKTDAFVQVDSNQNSASVAFKQLSDAVSVEVPIAAEVEILRSRFVLGKVVDHLGLDIQAVPLRLPFLGDGYARRYVGEDFGLAPKWLAAFNKPEFSWGGEKIIVTTLDVPKSLINVPLYLVYQGDGQFSVLTSERKPLIAGRVGQRLVTQMNGEPFSLYVQELKAKPDAVFLLRKLRREAAIYQIQGSLLITASKTAAGIVTLVYQGSDPDQITAVLTDVLNVYQAQNVDRRSAEAQQTLSFLTEQLPELRKQVETAEARLNQFKVQQGTADLTQETAAVLQRSVELEQQRAVLMQKRTETLQRYTQNHPVVESLNSQIAQIDGQIGQVAARVRQLPDVEQKALQISRDVQVSTALYISLLNRTQELEVVKSGTIGSIRIIDFPIKPATPYKPKSLLIFALFTLLGLASGLAIAFLLNALQNGIEDPALVERKLGLPTYGTIPYSLEQSKFARLLKKNKSISALLAITEPKGAAMEAIRSVRTALYFAQMDAPNNIVMLTGPEPSIGKSFVSVNLGAALADAGKNVLLIDADMRRGHLHKMLMQTRAHGLSELIAGSINTDLCIKSTPIAKLFLLSTGTIPPNPSELLVNERFVELLNGLSRQFDYVIIDTPPALAVTDAAVIGRHAGITLLVLKAGQHPIRMIEETANRLYRAGVQIRGTLFNQVGRNRSGKYGYKYGYYYGGYKYDYKSTTK